MHSGKFPETMRVDAGVFVLALWPSSCAHARQIGTPHTALAHASARRLKLLLRLDLLLRLHGNASASRLHGLSKRRETRALPLTAAPARLHTVALIDNGHGRRVGRFAVGWQVLWR